MSLPFLQVQPPSTSPGFTLNKVDLWKVLRQGFFLIIAWVCSVILAGLGGIDTSHQPWYYQFVVPVLTLVFNAVYLWARSGEVPPSQPPPPVV